MDNNRRLARKDKLKRLAFERHEILQLGVEADTHGLRSVDKDLLCNLGTNALRRSNILLDHSIANLHQSFPIGSGAELFARDNQLLRQKLQTTEAFFSTQPGNEATWNDYFRLANAHDFAVESAAAPAAFSSPSEHAVREKLVDGIAGLGIDRMSYALSLYDTSTNERLAGELRGAIAEMLATTLINYAQTPDRIAVPSTTHDDATQRTDLYIYHMSNLGGRRVPVQVKSGTKNMPPEGGFTLNSKMMGEYREGQESEDQGISEKSEHFKLARNLIKELNGEALNSEDTLMVKVAINEFEIKLLKQLRETPGSAL
ncbi:MAG: hypothetical protein EOO17_03180 [Chloroflexi bacterium]|nr:MAG: hypothetical protein EOO17_03180 [Chloroflexota bacterium]